MDARGRDVFKSCRATARTSATAIGTIGTIDGIGTTIVVATIGAVGTIGTIDATARRATTRGDADDRAIGTDEDEDGTTVMDGTNARSSEDGRTSGTTRTIAGGGETSERGGGSVDERIRDSGARDAGVAAAAAAPGRRGDGSRDWYGREDDRYRERDRGYAPPSSSAPPPRFGAQARRSDQRSTETREALASRWLEQNANNQRRVSDATMEKLKREIVIGNLVSGQIGATSLCELLNDLLKKVVPEACQAVGNLPPVLSIVMDAGQRYAHLQLRSAALATAALGLDQMHVLGRPVHVNRPDGYFENQDEPRSILDVAHVLLRPPRCKTCMRRSKIRRIRRKRRDSTHSNARRRFNRRYPRRWTRETRERRWRPRNRRRRTCACETWWTSRFY